MIWITVAGKPEETCKQGCLLNVWTRNTRVNPYPSTISVGSFKCTINPSTGELYGLMSHAKGKAIMVKYLAQEHKNQDRDSNLYSADQKQYYHFLTLSARFTGLEFHCWEVKATFILLLRALLLENLKVYGKLLKGHQGPRPWATWPSWPPWPPCNSRPGFKDYKFLNSVQLF